MAEKKLTAAEKKLVAEIEGKISRHFGKVLEDATPKMVYTACALTARDKVMEMWAKSHKQVKEEGSKKLYYLSFEFLMGRLLATNILNLMQTDEYKNALDSMGYKLSDVVELENDAGLGNGGLGRLAACFIDSLTTLDLPAYGCTIRYEYGLFRQKIVDGYQIELPDSWLENGNAWEIARPEETVEVKFGGRVHTDWVDGKFVCHYENEHTILAMPYDVPLVGYDSKIVNKLRLWSAKSPDYFNMSEFNRGNYIRAVEEKQLAEVISKVLYPEDNHTEGKELRLKQQYFLVSATLQWILREYETRYGTNWANLPDKAVIHINDTHPTLAIPELMRILMDEKGLGWEDAWDITCKTFAYTNHTVMSEALEKWPFDMFKKILPRISMIVEEINRRLMERLENFYPGDTGKHKWMAVLSDNKVFMANLCLATCFAVNGVSGLHTDILKKDIFADYYRMDESRFHAITNGITFRRWICNCNPELADLITSKIGDKWIKDYEELKKLKKFAKDKEFKAEFARIKHNNKVALAEYIKEHNGIDVNPDSIFDVQAKRLHEYKRQLMNILHILADYNKLVENPDIDYVPRTFIFGAKAAPGYTRAKLIIKLINTIGEKINNDERIKGKIKVVFLENYGVSIAEKLVVAADVSEQISTAGKEASGTGNMKFMLNGAVTIGTLDGANVEMLREVGEDNIYIFGLTADEVEARVRLGDSQEVKTIYATNNVLRRVMDQLVSGELEPTHPQLFQDLYQTLLFGDYGYADVYMVLRDFDAYCETHDRLAKDYQNRDKWLEKAIMNTASAGYFSSDRTINDYNEKIWHLKPIK
ncbi:MAG: glycogen/starch/alpha-glucan phosphorylase [Clostridia bacterium]|nr:glycogen/starch/alpha-glucan phosphorylase [Clostridia bacterium]MBQ8637415.1 glycogen/starch/alpha-glucan phosphorylase [Clostridia bacterium]